VLALALSAWAATAGYREAARTRADREQLVAMIGDLGTAVQQEQYERAYTQLFSPSFRQRVPLERFTSAWRPLRVHPTLGRLKGLGSRGLFNFEADETTGLRVAQGQVVLEFESQQPPDRPDIVFVFREGRWWIENIPALYPLEGTPGPGNLPR
jgi:hypothetical protein